eukprot:6248120-Amphidinium_carterae.1
MVDLTQSCCYLSAFCLQTQLNPCQDEIESASRSPSERQQRKCQQKTAMLYVPMVLTSAS